jgi:predicted alpha/beta superfamily hydrolase
MIWMALALAGCGAPLSAGSTGAGESTRPATVIVHYPAGEGHRITLRGPAGWDQPIELTFSGEDRWTAGLQLSGAVELKPLYDDVNWALGPNWTVRPGQSIDLWPRFFHDSGRTERIDGWYSNALGGARGVTIYYPPSYDENSGVRLPVIYMLDGQNLFDDASSFSGVSWDVAGALDRGAADASIHEAIVVAVDNSDNRTWEYTPTDGGDGGGGADTYLSFLADELKPQMDAQLRTLGDREHTALIGSSLGGLFSAYAGAVRGETFGLIGALSPSTWWDNNFLVGAVQRGPGRPARMYLDSGDAGPSNDDVDNTAELASAYRDLGVPLDYWVQHGAEHSELYWRQRVPAAFGFLVGGR